MIIKMLLGLTIIISSGLIGYKLSGKIKQKRDVYSAIIGLITGLISQIEFSRITVDRVIDSMPKVLSRILYEPLERLKRGEEVKINLREYSLEENQLFERFFNDLGRFDVDGQIEMLNYYKTAFCEEYNKLQILYAKSSKMYIKLGALAGVLIFVIII